MNKLKLSAITLLSVVALSACAPNLSSDKIATYTGGVVTKNDIYNRLKQTADAKTILHNEIVLNIFEREFGKDVKDDEVNKIYNDYKSASSSDEVWKEDLKKEGLTEETFKESIKRQLAFKTGVKKSITVSEDEKKELFKTWFPEQEFQLILNTDKDLMTTVKSELDGQGDFAKMANEHSMLSNGSDNGKYVLNYTDNLIPNAIKEKILTLNENQTSDVLTFKEEETGTEVFYIAKLIKKTEKKEDMSSYDKELTDIVRENKFLDTNVTNPIVKKMLDKYNVAVLDSSFKDIFTTYETKKE